MHVRGDLKRVVDRLLDSIDPKEPVKFEILCAMGRDANMYPVSYRLGWG
jgi:hypothetical protein